jgi:hypothetical protein
MAETFGLALGHAQQAIRSLEHTPCYILSPALRNPLPNLSALSLTQFLSSFRELYPRGWSVSWTLRGCLRTVQKASPLPPLLVSTRHSLCSTSHNGLGRPLCKTQDDLGIEPPLPVAAWHAFLAEVDLGGYTSKLASWCLRGATALVKSRRAESASL